ncbi:MAG: SUMF1/EgtB/PvdO family nonheme iron enzyme [Nitrospirae bacterium]|nr:SUMF1/EgtB/PvdO family nonheme iron enzyme [Nitrospirota bacterium]
MCSSGHNLRGQVKYNRVLRGGSWNNNPRNIRTANRNRNNPDNRNNNNGFRLLNTLNSLVVRFSKFTDFEGEQMRVQTCLRAEKAE